MSVPGVTRTIIVGRIWYRVKRELGPAPADVRGQTAVSASLTAETFQQRLIDSRRDKV